jgi:predicted DCC family thiol-disulfide oxidoreductase YuxK
MVPKLVYDDECKFCTWSATYSVRRSDIQPVRLSAVQRGESRLTDQERRRLPEGYEDCAQLLTDDAVYSCGEAVEQSLVIAGTLPAEIASFLREFEDYEWLRERLYHLVSSNRDVVSIVIHRDPPVSKHVSREDVDPDRSSHDR